VRALKGLLLLLPALAACPSTGANDGGTDATIDGPLACQADAAPAFDAAAGSDAGIPDLPPTHPPYQGACTSAQIADYAQCQGAKNTDLCTQFKPGGPGEACGKCIETPFDIDGGTTAWGVIVFRGTTAFMNVEGCVNDALGTYDCGNALHKLYQCQDLVCGGCTGTDFTNCQSESVADPSYCAPFANAVDPCENMPADAGCVPTGPCTALLGDAGIPCAAQNCFPNTSISDPTSQQVDWLKRIVGYMCGAVPDPNPCP
jgi:hypothetical protein